MMLFNVDTIEGNLCIAFFLRAIFAEYQFCVMFKFIVILDIFFLNKLCYMYKHIYI